MHCCRCLALSIVPTIDKTQECGTLSSHEYKYSIAARVGAIRNMAIDCGGEHEFTTMIDLKTGWKLSCADVAA